MEVWGVKVIESSDRVTVSLYMFKSCFTLDVCVTDHDIMSEELRRY